MAIMFIAAINDDRLLGEELVKPLRFCLQKLEQNYKPNLESILTSFVFVLGTALTSLPAGIGIVTKWIDLASRIDQLAHKGPAITYGFSFIMEQTSRLGDRLVAYLHAKHVSETHNLPLYFKPFKGAEYFALSKIETFTDSPSNPLYFKKIIHLNSRDEIDALQNLDREESTLYILPYFSESRMEQGGMGYHIDWKAFKPKVQELLEVLPPYELIPIPENAYAIGLHIRTGGTFDSKDTATMLPGKLPPKTYYIGELEKILTSSDLPQDRPLFVHIFTDDVDPEELKNWVQNEIDQRNLPKVILSFSKNPTLKDDVANMSRFHCLIRPDSNLSWSMSRVSDVLETEIFPYHFQVNEAWDQIAIDKVITVRPNGESIATTNYTMPVVTRPYLPIQFYQWFHKNM